MRKILLAGLVIGLCLIVYGLFRPLIVWPFGWQDLPEIKTAAASAPQHPYPQVTDLSLIHI